jgi:fatty acid desaturase
VIAIELGRSGDTAVLDDYSGAFHRLRSRLASVEGIRFVDFVRDLQPRYGRVLADIVIGYLGVSVSVAVVVWLASLGVPLVVTAGIGALAIGYWVAYLQLFLHEGAHFNLARTRDHSDRLSNALIAWIVGTSVQRYRKVHFQHHRALGMIDDSEHTYFFPLNLLFIVKGLVGWRVVEVLTSRRRYLDRVEAKQAAATTGRVEDDQLEAELSRLEPIMIIGIGGHAAIVGLSLWTGQWALAIAWVAGIGMAFPFFGALRQLLEHRSERADARTDYFKVPHGAYTRMFEQGPVSATFGAAGFSRHLLHHWEPQVSYTNLRELEEFLKKTELGDIIRARRTTYADAFLRLFSLR